MRVFITSVKVAGDFGGTSQGDALCDTAALAANKGGTWKAWLSSSTTAAPARLADVGPWYQQQADGGLSLTFNNKANLSTTPLTGISVDEAGRTTYNSFWTGTGGGGTISSGCSSWVNTNGYIGTIGEAGTTTTSWTASTSNASCASAYALLCFEQSHSPAPAPVPTTRKRTFITSVKVAGDFGGTSQGDTLCNTAAQAANKGGTWKAWLSSSTTAAPARLADVGPWYQQQADGGVSLTFNNKANLSTTPLTGLSVDEAGRTTYNSFWTGTGGGGTISSGCSSWVNTNGYIGTIGEAGTTTTSWTASTSNASCASTYALLCIEQ